MKKRSVMYLSAMLVAGALSAPAAWAESDPTITQEWRAMAIQQRDALHRLWREHKAARLALVAERETVRREKFALWLAPKTKTWRERWELRTKRLERLEVLRKEHWGLKAKQREEVQVLVRGQWDEAVALRERYELEAEERRAWELVRKAEEKARRLAEEARQKSQQQRVLTGRESESEAPTQ